jgi:mRNA interferase MazF
MTMVRREVDIKPVGKWEVWNADLGIGLGCEQGGVRPVIVVQNDIGNKYSPGVTVLPLTSSKTKRSLPTHVEIKADEIGLYNDSIIMAEQVRTIDKMRLDFKIADIPTYMIKDIERAMHVQQFT